MSSFRLSAEAKKDLTTIGRFTKAKWGTHQRNKYLKELDACFSKIAESSNIGLSIDNLRQGYRKFYQGSHVVYYRNSKASKTTIEIIRVLHKSMDAESHL